MHELQSLGLDCSDASMVCINFNGTYAYVGGEEAKAIKDCINGKFYVEITPAYTLEDILMKLPKYLYEKELEVTKTEVSYQYLHYCRKYTLIRNAFEVLKWVLKNHPDKIEKL